MLNTCLQRVRPDRSLFRDIESYLRVVVGLDEDNIQLILKQYTPKFVTYEIPPGIYSIKGISKIVYTNGDHEETLQFECDDISMKTKFILTRFDGTFGKLRFSEKVFSLHYWFSHHIRITNLLMQFMLILRPFTLVKIL